MKTKFLSIVASLSLVALLSTSAIAGSNKNQNGTVVTEAAGFNKIEVRGNVELYLADGSANSVTAYNNYYGESALVQNQNGVLRISSYGKEKLVVYVTVANLNAISAYDEAVVKSFKNLSSINLEVNLYNNAAAQLNLNAYQAVFNVHDRAKADLQGTINVCDLVVNQSASVNSVGLKADQFAKSTVNNSKTVKSTEEVVAI